MATVVLSAAGAALGGAVGGSVLGLSSVAIGRAIGATIGRRIDEHLLGQGSEPVETGRVDRFRLMGAQEGRPLQKVHGRVRVGGHVIWATRFKEHFTETGGGKGGGPVQRQYAYSVSLAIALCEGEIAGVGRIWADGEEIAPKDLTMRVYEGGADQMPDPLIEAVEGAGSVPAFRGTAYVVLEDLMLTRFGNRVPQLSFEVIRPVEAQQSGSEGDMARGLPGVALMPGTGEYALATTPVHFSDGLGGNRSVNVNTPNGETDFVVSMASLQREAPNCGAVGLIVSWFGDDLRIGECALKPKVEQVSTDGEGMPWQVSGVTRGSAEAVPRVDDLPVYGGTPCDASVVEAIAHMNGLGQDVMFYPFILMEQGAGNGLSDPWSDGADQPVLPWRGRITTSVAPGRDGSPDGTIAAEAEVAAFFGAAQASDFAIVDGQVVYTGPQEWSYRRFILHYAHLCALAGGVESFCIGSEMRDMTQIRGAGGSFPAVEGLQALAAEVRQVLGSGAKIGYAADWSEYFGYHPKDGSGDVYFHLDPLWADDNIDFIGIDNYMPLSDWRDGTDHLDAYWGSIYDADYLAANIEGGEGFDWFYHSDEARDAQIRTRIEDVDHGEDWVWRYKDIRGWWEAYHHNRIAGVRLAEATGWVPGSKPIRFTELGCAAIDKGTNQPNKFLDPKSSESAIPHYSRGHRDETIQRQYFKAMLSYWKDGFNNPMAELYEGRMIDMDHAYAWAWDARPYPAFPNNRGLWTDAENYAAGHWLNGRTSAKALGDLLVEICADAGVEAVNVDKAHGVVRGYLTESTDTARAELQALLMAYGLDAVEWNGELHFRQRSALQDEVLKADEVVAGPRAQGIERRRGSEGEQISRVRFGFVEGSGRFETAWEEATDPEKETDAVSGTELSLVLTRSEGRLLAERWLAEAKVSRDRISFSLPMSKTGVSAGSVVGFGDGTLYRVESVEVAEHRSIEAVRVEAEAYQPARFENELAETPSFVAPVPVFPLFLDLPLITGDELANAPHVAVTAKPWPGNIAVFNAGATGAFELNRTISERAVIGVTQTDLRWSPSGIFDRSGELRVKLASGELQSVARTALLNGANLMAIGDGSAGKWEVFQFEQAELIAPDTYAIRNRLRGQFGTDAILPDIWPAGSNVVLLDQALQQIAHPPSQRNLARSYRVGPASRALDDPSFVEQDLSFEAVGLRPYAPCHLDVNRTGTGDSLQWIRRSRVDGDNWDVPEIPIGEESESYLLRIRTGGGIVREVTVSAPEWTYPRSDQIEDGAGDGYWVDIAQLSATFGAGAVATLEVV